MAKIVIIGGGAAGMTAAIAAAWADPSHEILILEHKNQLGYFGRVSGREENKMEKCGMAVNNEDVAPYFEESSVIVLCKVIGKSDFDSKSVDENVYEWYQEEVVHSQYYGEIVKVLVKDYK